MAEKKRVILIHYSEPLWPWEFVKEIADVKADFGSGVRRSLTIKELQDFKPHVVCGGGRIGTAEMMDACENLEFIQTLGMGYDNIDLDAATESGIMVSNLGAVGLSSASVAELAWAHILAVARKIPQQNAAFRSGETLTRTGWRKQSSFFRSGPVLWGKTLGVLGLGKIGKRSALIGRLGFNMRVIACDPYVDGTFSCLLV